MSSIIPLLQGGGNIVTSYQDGKMGQYDGSGNFRAYGQDEIDALNNWYASRQNAPAPAPAPAPVTSGLFSGVQGTGAQPQQPAAQPAQQPTMYAGGSKGFDMTGGQNPYAQPGSMSQLQALGWKQFQANRDKAHAQWQGQPGMAYAGGSPNFDMSPGGEQLAGSDMGMSTNPRTGPNFGSALPSYANSNPYLQGAMNSIQSQVTQNLQRNVLPQLGRNSVATGGYGGSRQGIAEGLAMGDAATAATNAMGNLAFQGFNADRNFGLANDALDLNIFNANQGWANQGFNNTLTAYDKMLGWNQNYGIGNATNAQNTPLNYWQALAGTGATLGGLGGTNTQQLQGNPYLGALGGALTGWQLMGG